MTVANTVLHIFYKLISVHHRHHHVGYDKVKFCLFYKFHRLASVSGSFHLVFSRQQLFHQHQQFHIVLYNKNGISILIGRIGNFLRFHRVGCYIFADFIGKHKVIFQ